MSGQTRWLSVAALVVAITGLVLIAGRVLLAPVQGDLLVLASAPKTDRIEASTVELHSSAGWTTVGRFAGHTVPPAPATTTLLESKAGVGTYDAVRIGNEVVPIRIDVQQTVLAPILIGVSAGRPLKQAIYAGGENVSLGLNELSGQLKTMPAFSLIDQFGRAFSNETIAGHDVMVAAFHISCHTTCPLYTRLFLQLRKQLPSSVMLVEATTAPDEDTPEALRSYAGSIGASWTFATGTPDAVASFWAPFTVQLSNGQSHSSTLAFIDSHGYIRTYYQGVPDVAGALPAELVQQLNPDGLGEYRSHGNGWGASQVLDTLRSIDSLSPPAATTQGSAPDFTLTSVSGEKVSLSQFRGRPVLINFWATYCVPCRVEMPLIERMAAQHPKLVVLLVDERDSTPAARSFVNELHIRATVVLDTDGAAGDLYRIVGLPTTLFVRADGSMEGRYLGQTDEQILSRHIAAISA